jgi:hypothetical protein
LTTNIFNTVIVFVVCLLTFVKGMHLNFDTILNADAVEFCPVKGLRDVLICGTYQLKESDAGRGRAEDQTRIGRLYSLSITQDYDHEDTDPSEDSNGEFSLEVPPTSKLSLRQNFQLDCCGVFDIKFSSSSISGGALLGHAAADGFLYTYKVAGDGEARSISRLASIDCRGSPEDANALALSLDWSNRIRSSSSSLAAAVSLSDGSLCVVDTREDGTLEVCARHNQARHLYAPMCSLHGYIFYAQSFLPAPSLQYSRKVNRGIGQVRQRWPGHELEAWVTSWDGHTDGVLYRHPPLVLLPRRRRRRRESALDVVRASPLRPFYVVT